MVEPAPTENNSPELTQTPEVVTPETDAEPSAEDTQQGHDDPVAKLQARFERRIGRATAARYQEAARAAQAEQRARDLEARLAQYEQQQTGQQPEALTPEKVLPLAQHLAQQIRQQERVVESVRKVLDSGRSLEGFDAACNAVDAEISFYDNAGRPTPFLSTVMECESPAKVLHHLGRNPELVAEMADMTPTQQARRLDRLEAALNKPAEPKVTAAPKPLAPLKGGPAASNQYTYRPDMSDREFAQMRAAQMKARRAG